MDSKKTQTVVVVILVVTALLGIAGAFFVYNLSTQDEIARERGEHGEFCACITAYTTPECNDCNCTQIESQALESKIGEIVDGVCTLDCNNTEAAVGQQEMIECLIPQVRGTSCHSISVRDVSTRELIIPPIPTNDPVLITANFVPRIIGGDEENFTKYMFVINGITSEIPSNEITPTNINGQEIYTPEIEFDNFQGVDTLTVQAIGYSDKDPEGDSSSRYCYKQYDLTSEREPLCSNLTAYTQEGEQPNTIEINRLELTTPNLTQQDKISIEFSFENENIQNIRTEIIPQELLEEIMVNETIFLEYGLLYLQPQLYTQQNTFPILDSETLGTEEILLRAQVYVNDAPVNSNLCRENIDLIAITDRDVDEDRQDDDHDEIDIDTDIQVSMEGPSCVRKAADEHSVSRTNYRITITNNTEIPEEITNITNKLPLGFRYVEQTTTINNNLISDEILDITAIGESQELVWRHDWTIEPNTSLVLEYGVNVTHNAIDGENQNEAVVTPVNIPEHMDGLRAEIVTLVSDECVHEEELPDTGIIRHVSFLIGIATLLFGILVYQGRIDIIDRTIFKIISAKAVKRKLMSPQEYLEDSILEEDEED